MGLERHKEYLTLLGADVSFKRINVHFPIIWMYLFFLELKPFIVCWAFLLLLLSFFSRYFHEL